MLLTTPPTLSDDVYRYLWDGYVANQDVSPYSFAINSPELDYLDVPIRAQANNAWMASPYLPAAQVVFWSITAVFPLKPIYLQITMVLFELASAWLLSRLLNKAQLPAHRILLYLWNPLIIIEIAHSAHLDAWMILLALVAIYLTAHNSLSLKNMTISPLVLALATLTKPLPILIAPILFWRWRWFQRIIYGLFVIGLLIPFGLQAGWGLNGDLNGTGLFGALRIYTAQWNFNSGVFYWLEQFFRRQGIENPTELAKLIIATVMVGVVFVVFIKARTRNQNWLDTLRLMSVPFIAYVLLTPTLHPWYILTLLTFLPFLSPVICEPGTWWWLIVPWLYLSYALIFSLPDLPQPREVW
jgi:alpha-1,6-mannosyltransferase